MSQPSAKLRYAVHVVPHAEQRYDTCGDYFTDAVGVRRFIISDMGNRDYEFLVALHELIESHFVQKRGIADQSIDAFDLNFEARRQLGEVPEDAEPGNDPQAPYYREHRFATTIERLVADELGVDWDAYDDTVVSL